MSFWGQRWNFANVVNSARMSRPQRRSGQGRATALRRCSGGARGLIGGRAFGDWLPVEVKCSCALGVSTVFPQFSFGQYPAASSGGEAQCIFSWADDLCYRRAQPAAPSAGHRLEPPRPLTHHSTSTQSSYSNQPRSAAPYP